MGSHREETVATAAEAAATRNAGMLLPPKAASSGPTETDTSSCQEQQQRSYTCNLRLLQQLLVLGATAATSGNAEVLHPLLCNALPDEQEGRAWGSTMARLRSAAAWPAQDERQQGG